MDYKWVYGHKPVFKLKNVITMKQHAASEENVE